MTKCTEFGCRNIEWKCADCGRTTSTAKFYPDCNCGEKQAPCVTCGHCGHILSMTVPEHLEWISVKDRLPENPGHYITSDGENVGITWKSFHRFEIMPVYYSCVTHWMPLPKPPRENDR